MVVVQCSDNSTTRSRYSRVHRISRPIGRCGLNQLLPAEYEFLQITRHTVVERIHNVTRMLQTYVASSRRCIRGAIVYGQTCRVRNNILRSSLVFLIVDRRLLLELVLVNAGAMASLHNRLRGLAHPDLNAMTILITDIYYVNEVLKLHCS